MCVIFREYTAWFKNSRAYVSTDSHARTLNHKDDCPHNCAKQVSLQTAALALWVDIWQYHLDEWLNYANGCLFMRNLMSVRCTIIL